MAGALSAEEYDQRIGEPEAVVAREASLVESQRQMIESQHEVIARLERSSPAHPTERKVPDPLSCVRLPPERYPQRRALSYRSA